MQEFALIARIQELCNARGWTYYPLAKERGIKMPSFFGYMLWSVGILFPTFLAMDFLFL